MEKCAFYAEKIVAPPRDILSGGGNTNKMAVRVLMDEATFFP